VTNTSSEIVALQATEINPQTGAKSWRTEKPRRSRGPVGEGAVFLGNPDDPAPTLVLGEGVETVLTRCAVGPCACLGAIRFIEPKPHHRRAWTLRLFDGGFVERASVLGWTALDLFGCDRDKPFARIDRQGLCWLIAGSRLVHISENAAIIETWTGAQQTWRRKPHAPDRVLAWELMPWAGEMLEPIEAMWHLVEGYRLIRPSIHRMRFGEDDIRFAPG
jgi:hypothetical protein